MYIIIRLTDTLNRNFLTSAKAETWHLYCGKWRKFQSHAVTLTLIRQCPMLNSSELFTYTTICSSFKWIGLLFFESLCTVTVCLV